VINMQTVSFTTKPK